MKIKFVICLDSIDYMKMAVEQELRDALRVKRLNDELLEYFTSSLGWIMNYCERNNIPLPERKKILELMNKAIEIEKKFPTDYISDESLQAHKDIENRRRLDGTLFRVL